MELLLKQLHQIHEYKALSDHVRQHQSCAVTGIGQINRSHIIAGLYRDIEKPMLLICSDDASAKRLQEDLKCFLGETFPVLPTRELTFYDTAAVSRGWEHRRMRQLYDLSRGNTKLQIVTWDSLSQRTIPKEALHCAAFCLTVGGEYDLQTLTQKTVMQFLKV